MARFWGLTTNERGCGVRQKRSERVLERESEHKG